jgi:hypothetical protein
MIKVFPDDLPLVPEAQNKIIEAMMGVGPHDMPQNGAAAYFHHRFRPKFGFLSKPCAFSTTQDDNFHKISKKGIIANWLSIRSPEKMATVKKRFSTSCIFLSLALNLAHKKSKRALSGHFDLTGIKDHE